MKPLTEKQKKYLWIAAGVLVLLHFILPRIIGFFRSPTVHSAVVAKPSAYVVAPIAPPTPALPPPSPEAIAATKYGGVWGGSEMMPDQTKCGIRLEIRLSDDLPKKLKGYETKACAPVQPMAGGKGTLGQKMGDIIRETSPVSAVLTGTPSEGGITFTVDSVIGTPYDGCSLTGMTITGFGQGLLQAQWQSQSAQQAPCATNQMLLKKMQG